MKLCGYAVIAVLAFSGLAWAGRPATPKAMVSASTGMQDFDRNASLGRELSGRAGTKQELDELQTLADRGLRAAHELVAKEPKSVEAQYLLGTWLIYGYRVIERERTREGPTGELTTEKVPTVALGLSDDPQEGLDALKQSAELAPQQPQYALDYAAALLDTDHPEQAMGALKTLWAERPGMSAADRIRTGLMLSDVYAAQQRLLEAREWLYAALLVNPENAEAVRRLRLLDAAAVAIAPPVAPAPPEAAPPAGPEIEEEVAPEQQEETPEEYVPEEEQPEEIAPEDYAPGSEEEEEVDPEVVREIVGEDESY